MYDLVIRNALVFNGLDEPPILGSVGIKDGCIVEIAPFIEQGALVETDATGLWLAPGFVDIHTHYDIEVEISPGLPESVRHGVTTVVMGNCSLSVTIGDPADLADIFLRVETLPSELVHRWLADAVQWQTPHEYFKHLKELNLGPNVAAMLGHSAIRAKVMGLDRSLRDIATKSEIMAMRCIARDALDAGCIGISVDMVHWHKVSGVYAGSALPSHHANYSEYKMLADVCREYDAVFQVTPNPNNILSFINILRLSPGLFRPPLRNTILSALDMKKHPSLWRLFPFISSMCNRLLNCNIRFQTLTEPFTIYADGPITPVFEEFATGVLLNSCRSSEDRMKLWRDKKFVAAFKKEWKSKWPHTFHRDLTQMTILKAPDPQFINKTFAQVAKEMRQEPLTTLCELLAKYDDKIRWVACGANHRSDIRQKLMSHEYIFPGFSDAGAHSRNLAYFDSSLSLLRQAVNTQFISPQRAIKRVTSEPARLINLKTGVLQKGAKADIVLLRPDKLKLPIPEPQETEDSLLGGAMRMVKRDKDPAIAHVYIAGLEVVRNSEPLLALGMNKTGDVLTNTVEIKNANTVLTRYRNRVNDDLVDHPFVNYWDVFVLKHQSKFNVYCHCLAVVIMYTAVILAVATKNLAWLLLIPVSQITGLMGHYFFEASSVDTRDTIFSWRAMVSLNRLLWLVVVGGYSKELIRVQKILNDFLRREAL